jgi:hypothetical protein
MCINGNAYKPRLLGRATSGRERMRANKVVSPCPSWHVAILPETSHFLLFPEQPSLMWSACAAQAQLPGASPPARCVLRSQECRALPLQHQHKRTARQKAYFLLSGRRLCICVAIAADVRMSHCYVCRCVPTILQVWAGAGIREINCSQQPAHKSEQDPERACNTCVG